jgi:hypothetical protein
MTKMTMGTIHDLVARRKLCQEQALNEQFKRIVDVIFDYSDNLHFHSLCVDTTRVDHARFNASNREIGFNKKSISWRGNFGGCILGTSFMSIPIVEKPLNSPKICATFSIEAVGIKEIGLSAGANSEIQKPHYRSSSPISSSAQLHTA